MGSPGHKAQAPGRWWRPDMNLTASLALQHDKSVPLNVGAEPRQITLGPTHIVLRGLPDNREFWKVVNAVAFTSQRGAGRRAVYRAVAYYAALTDARTCYASVATMANRAGLGTSATREQLRALERNGDIEGIGNCRGANKPAVYTLTVLNRGQRLPLTKKVIKNVRTTTYTPRERVSCETHGRSWFKADGRHCFECAQARMKVKRSPRRARGGMPTYHDRPLRPVPPMTPAQTDAAIELALANGYRQVGGQWRRR